MRRLVYYLDAVGYGGAVNYVERLVARINADEFHVTIACPDCQAFRPLREVLAPFPVRWVGLAGQPSLKGAAYQAASGTHRARGPLSWAARLSGIRSAGKAALGLLGLLEEARRLPTVQAAVRGLQPDLLHVNLDRFPDVSGKLALFGGHAAGASAVLATLHCSAQLPVFPKRIHHYFDRRALRAADRIIVVSEKQRQELVQWYGAPEGRLQLIPNGAASECFERRTSRLSRAQLGFEASDFLVVHVGSVVPSRGQLVLAQALSNLRGICPRLRAAFLGGVFDVDYAATVDQLLATQISTPFRRFGHRPDATEILRLADVAVVCSFQEGHSFALLEAMALGRAIVATDIESNAESLGHGEAGLLVPPGDSEAMAVSIRRLHDDEGLRVKLGAAAKARATRLYSEERMIQSTLDVYRNLGPRES